ncbi:MAG: ParB/RepB/Spo0J family partition protein [Rhodomicrobium sp.]
MTDEPFMRMIPLSKLVSSLANVRKTGRDYGIEELAASIAAHGLLQNLTVRPVLDGKGNETAKFEAVAGGRRLAASKVLACSENPDRANLDRDLGFPSLGRASSNQKPQGT